MSNSNLNNWRLHAQQGGASGRQATNSHDNGNQQQQDVVANLLSRVTGQPPQQPPNPTQPAKADWQVALEEAKAASQRFVTNKNKINPSVSAAQGESKVAHQNRMNSSSSRSTSTSGNVFNPFRANKRAPAPRVEIDLAASSSGDEGETPRGGDALLGTITRSDALPEKVHSGRENSQSSQREMMTQTQRASQQQQQKTTTPTNPSWLPRGTRPRSNYAARTLDQLQNATLRWYMTHQHRRGNQRPTARLLPLRFNDISVVTISQWCAQTPTNATPTASKTRKRPTVDTRYRKCSQCRLYGHYETECPSLTEETIIRFGNGVLEWKQQEEATAAESNPNATAFGLDDTDYDVVVELCDGFAVEQRKAPETRIEQESSRKSTATFTSTEKAPAQPKGGEEDEDELEIDGFAIRTAKSRETFSGQQSPSSHNNSTVELHIGSPVLWYHPQAETASNSDDINDEANNSSNVATIGYVKDLNHDEHQALVQVVRSIPPSSSADYSDVEVPAEYSEHWVPLDHLFVNNEAATTTQPLRKRGHPSGTDGTSNSGNHRNGGKGVKKPRSKRARLQHRYRMIGRINQDDMSIRPARQTRQRPDGTWVAPAGRKPNGREWDPSRGLWVLAAQKKVSVAAAARGHSPTV